MSAPLLTAAEAEALDREATGSRGIPPILLMENAASACVRALLTRFPAEARRGVVVLAGPGNNGADGLAIARRLAGLSVPVDAMLVGPGPAAGSVGAAQADWARATGVPLRNVRSRADLAFASRRMTQRGVVVDALFGTGLGRPLIGLFADAAAAITAARAGGARVVAVDIPSGVHGSTGRVHGAAAPADLTVTFGAAKLGHFVEPGRALRGELVVADIGVRGESDGCARLIDAACVRDAVRDGDPEAHKGTFGHLLIVAGGPGHAGAAVLAAQGAVRGGAGLVTLALPAGLDEPALCSLPPEAMLVRLPGRGGTLADGAASVVLELLSSRNALAIGPGLGTQDGCIHIARRLFAEARVPAVFDADALNGLALGGLPAPPLAGPRVVTPHPGEAARLLGVDPASLRTGRIEAVRAVAARAGAIAVLKGAGTLVAEPSGRLRVSPTGSPGLASGGTGDVLTGMVGALLARGVDPFDAACAAVYWHGLAGDREATARGAPCLTARDVVEGLSGALLAARAGIADPFGLDPVGFVAR